MDQLHRPTDGQRDGLSSDEPSVAKRENPYLRKNRHPQEKPRADKPTRDQKNRYAFKETVAQFLSEHARLLAAIATVLVILTLICFVDIKEVIDSVTDMVEEVIYQPITMEYVHALNEKSGPIMWEDLQKFRHRESVGSDSITWRITVEGGAYEVWISGTSTVDDPKYVYLYHMDSGKRMDLNKDDLLAFLHDTSNSQ